MKNETATDTTPTTPTGISPEAWEELVDGLFFRRLGCLSDAEKTILRNNEHLLTDEERKRFRGHCTPRLPHPTLVPGDDTRSWDF